MIDPIRRPVRVAVAAVILGAGLRLWFILQTPVGGDATPLRLSPYNDEVAHASYILHVIQHGGLPGDVEHIQEPGALQRGNFENYQPPAYYAICAAVGIAGSVKPLESATMLGRWFSLLFGMGLLLAWIKIARELRFSQPAESLGLIFLSLSGVLVRFSSTAGNESLAWLCAGGVFLMTARIIESGWNAQRWAWLTFWLAFGLWTKVSLLIIAPLPFLTLRNHRSPRAIAFLTISGTVVLLATFPLWLRNVHEFGSLLPLSAGFGMASWRVPDFETLTYAARSFVFPWQEFWQSWVGLAIMLPVMVMFCWSIMRRETCRVVGGNAGLVAVTLLSVAGFLFLNCRYDQAEARYLFLAWPAISALFAHSGITGVAAIGILMTPYLLLVIPSAGL